MTNVKKLTPIKAIRAKCLDCCAGQVYEVTKCTVTRCPLYDYRHGKRPKKAPENEGENETETEGGECTVDDIPDGETLT